MSLRSHGARLAGALMLTLAFAATPSQAAAASQDLAAYADQLLAAAYPADGPGAAVLVMKDGQPLLRNGSPESVFRIASLTKQFTAVAVLQLVESGKIALESVSGMPYADYLKKNVFPRAGLTSTSYGDVATIVPRRVPGYANDGGKLVNARYLSMTLPFSAGALLSTVDDLGKWNAALAAGKVVDRKLLDRAWTPLTAERVP